MHSYDDVKDMRIYVWTNDNATFSVEGTLYNAKVPMDFSVIRLLAVFAGISLLWCILLCMKKVIHERASSCGLRCSCCKFDYVVSLNSSESTVYGSAIDTSSSISQAGSSHKSGELSIPIGAENDLLQKFMMMLRQKQFVFST